MANTVTPWPPLHAYALAHRCTTCGAQPGEPCDAPRKNAQLARVDATLARFERPPMDHDQLHRMHGPRQDAGRRHYRRDVGAAPWWEDREPGRRYDTLGDAWTPGT
jgi:hypothetical protein